MFYYYKGLDFEKIHSPLDNIQVLLEEYIYIYIREYFKTTKTSNTR